MMTMNQLLPDSQENIQFFPGKGGSSSFMELIVYLTIAPQQI